MRFFSRNPKFILVPTAILFLASGFFVYAQTPGPTGADVATRQAQLQAQLDELNKEISAQQAILDTKKTESASIQRDIAILDAKIAQAKLIIQAKTINIEQLGKAIDTKSQTIDVLSDHLNQNQQSLSQLIKKTNEVDDVSLAEVVLSTGTLSDIFNDVDIYNTLQNSLYVTYKATQSTRTETENQRTALDQQRNAESDALAAIETEKANIAKDEAQKQQLLKINKNQQQAYQEIITQRQKQAAQIKSALFQLQGTAAIPFGTALDYANIALQKTGVRPAFLLAILTQETNLGANIGTCNRPTDPPSKHWQVIMKPDRDQKPYLQITSALGLDPDSMPLSCPWQGGWGGAMGPAQFIPSTWIAFIPQLSPLLNNEAMPNPWDPKDAFMASALYLHELGADARTPSAERTAALRYYAGAAWNKAKNAFYGDQVMARATSIQTNMIDPLQNI